MAPTRRATYAVLRDLGNKIRRLRKERGWSQEEFAARCGLHRTYVGAIERGERNVSVINVKKISAALRVPLARLFGKE